MTANSDAPDANQQATARRVQSALSDMHEYRQQFQAERQAGDISPRTRLGFQAAVLACHDEIRPYRRRAKELWRDPFPSARRQLDAMDSDKRETLDVAEYPDWSFGLDELSEQLQPEQGRRQIESGMGRTRVEQAAQPPRLPDRQLIECSYRIDELAREMGFAPPPERTVNDLDGGTI